ncbi:acyltransferase [Bradyrhizobium sp. WYCCWR 12699]|uniref:acyltransferase family protein n=1 Tax=Bradyrhizobium sp. WYCCWR 12699 TaxID=3064203 RepID=UPI0028A4E7C0|nr:acyltransferase [Bradyrhizobium sp. WYCCWR 12699]MDT4740688.1 acyltransferase [Bradyrhizobium sp. WYCCWR 12699]
MGLLRILLALAVIGDHARPPFDWLHFTAGTIAVEMFFVVSGFYMQMVLSQRYTSATAFYVSRAIRIYPTYWIIAGVTYFSFWPINGFRHISNLGWQPATLVFASNLLIFFQDTLLFLGVDHERLFFTANFQSASNLPSSYLIVRPSWTLALELYFYLFAPYLARVRNSFLITLALTLTAGRLAAYHAGLDHDPWFYRFFPFELPLFLLGMLGYRLFDRNEHLHFLRSKVLALSAIVAMIVLGRYFTLSVPAQYSFIAAATSVLVVPMAFAAFKDVSIDRFVGDLSYPIYLIHFPIIQFVSSTYANVVGLSFALSCLIVICLDRPLDRIRHRLTTVFHKSEYR